MEAPTGTEAARLTRTRRTMPGRSDPDEQAEPEPRTLGTRTSWTRRLIPVLQFARVEVLTKRRERRLALPSPFFALPLGGIKPLEHLRHINVDRDLDPFAFAIVIESVQTSK